MTSESETDRALRWLSLELFSLWRRRSPPSGLPGPDTISDLIECAQIEGRTLDGQTAYTIAARIEEGDLIAEVTELVKAFEQSPRDRYDVPGLKSSGFRVDDRIGHGAMGVVYRAWQYDPGRAVALKFIAVPADLLDRHDLEERFSQETRAQGGLNHPHIGHVYQSGFVLDWSGRPLSFIAMELLSGGTLHDAFRVASESKTDTLLRCNMFARICDAIVHAHEHGVYHRDIKPTNVMLHGPSGYDPRDMTPKVVDFGLAILTKSNTVRAVLGSSGTPGYRAPTMLLHQESSSARADIFSLGILLYRMICGHEPGGLCTSDLAFLRHIEDHDDRCKAEAEHVSSILASGIQLPDNIPTPTIARDLESIIERCVCTRENHGDAYTTASEVLDDVNRLLDGRAVSAHSRRTARIRTRRWLSRNRWRVALLASLLTISAGIGTWMWTSQAASSRLHRADADRLLTPLGHHPGPLDPVQIDALHALSRETRSEVLYLLFERAFSSPPYARQLSNRAPEIAKCAIRMNDELRTRVHRSLMTSLRANSSTDSSLEVRMACVSVGDALASYLQPDGADFSALAIHAILDGVEDGVISINDGAYEETHIWYATYNDLLASSVGAYERGGSLLDRPMDTIVALAPYLSEDDARDIARRYPSIIGDISNWHLAHAARSYVAVAGRIGDPEIADALSQEVLDSVLARIEGESYHGIQDVPNALFELRVMLTDQRRGDAAAALASLKMNDDPGSMLLGRVRLIGALGPSSDPLYRRLLADQTHSLLQYADGFALSLIGGDERFLGVLASLDTESADLVASELFRSINRESHPGAFTYELSDDIDDLGYNKQMALTPKHTLPEDTWWRAQLLVALATQLSAGCAADIAEDTRHLAAQGVGRLQGLAQVCVSLSTRISPDQAAELADACAAECDLRNGASGMGDLCAVLSIQSEGGRYRSWEAVLTELSSISAYNLAIFAEAWPEILRHANEETIQAIERGVLMRVRSGELAAENIAPVIASMSKSSNQSDAWAHAAMIASDRLIDSSRVNEPLDELDRVPNASFTEPIKQVERLEALAILWPLLTDAQRTKCRDAVASHFLRRSPNSGMLLPSGAGIMFSPNAAQATMAPLIARWAEDSPSIAMLSQEVRTFVELSTRVTPAAAAEMAEDMMQYTGKKDWLTRYWLLHAFKALAARMRNEHLIKLYWQPECTAEAMSIIVGSIASRNEQKAGVTSLWAMSPEYQWAWLSGLEAAQGISRAN